jgi:hypothetical protein
MSAQANAAIEMTEAEQRLWDLFIFARRTLGFDQFTKLHMGWFEELLKSQFLILMAPRGHMKSSAITTAYTLWRLVQDRNMRILIVNETLSNSRNFLREIKEHITSNERFLTRYGSWETTASKWTEDSVVIPRTRISKEASLSVGGVLGNLVSLHNDLIVLGVAVTMFFTLPANFLSLLLALFSGFFIYIGASDLLPESHHNHPTFWTTFMTLLGMLVLYGAIKLAEI